MEIILATGIGVLAAEPLEPLAVEYFHPCLAIGAANLARSSHLGNLGNRYTRNTLDARNNSITAATLERFARERPRTPSRARSATMAHCKIALYAGLSWIPGQRCELL